MSLSIQPYNIQLQATSIKVSIDDFVFGTSILLKIMFFDSGNNYLISYYCSIDGQDYQDMTTSQNSDLFIKSFVENKYGLSIGI
jgi:hypothetical protein